MAAPGHRVSIRMTRIASSRRSIRGGMSVMARLTRMAFVENGVVECAGLLFVMALLTTIGSVAGNFMRAMADVAR